MQMHLGRLALMAHPCCHRLPEFLAACLVCASDVIVRTGERAEAVCAHYLAELWCAQPDMVGARGHTL